MPNITITEEILPRGISAIGTDIPYIPGFVGKDDSGNLKTAFSAPKLFTSLRDFKSEVGDVPYKFESAHTLSSIKIVDEGECDRSYIMAAELLRQGMPVYYHAFGVTPESETITTFNSIVDGKLSMGDVLFAPTTGSVTVLIDTSLTFSFKTNKALSAGDELKIKSNTGLTFTPPTGSPFTVSGNTLTISSSVTKGTSLTIKISSSEGAAGEMELTGIDIGTETTNTVSDMILTFYNNLNTYLSSGDLNDPSEYTIKYVTTGGYPNVGLSTALEDDPFVAILSVAKARKDCVAIAEYVNNSSAVLSGSGSFFNELNTNKTNYASDFGTAFYPWALHTLDTRYDGSQFGYVLPACYSYLISLAKSIRNNPNWLAIAGVGRGFVPSINSLNLTKRLSNTIADSYQPINGGENGAVALNAITMIKPYGLTIWGNRTLKEITKTGLVPSHFLNTRNMISDVKKIAYSAAKALMYEQNSELLWLDFKGRLTPYLERLVAGNGISGYSIVKSNVKSDGSTVKREELACVIRVYPITAVESFDINIVISDSEVTVGE